MAYVDVALGSNGYADDVLLGPTGDLVLLIDTPGNPAASQQLLARLVLTNPIFRDSYQNPVGRPDDLFNINLGSGVRATVGEPLTFALQTSIQSTIAAAIAQHPNFASSPAPSVTVYTDGNGEGLMYVAIQAYTVNGSVVVLPALAIQ